MHAENNPFNFKECCRNPPGGKLAVVAKDSYNITLDGVMLCNCIKKANYSHVLCHSRQTFFYYKIEEMFVICFIYIYMFVI